MDLSQKYNVLDKKDNAEWLKMDESDDTEFLIAPAMSEGYLAATREVFTADQLRSLNPDTGIMEYFNDKPAQELHEKELTVASKALLLGWKNLKEDGKEIKYSEKKCREILGKYPSLLNFVQESSVGVLSKSLEEDEETVKK